MNNIPYGRQSISQDDIDAVIACLKSDFLTQGPMVEQFEHTLQQATGAKYAAACSNGTTALHLAVMALGLKPGEKIICPPISFVASSNCALYVGAEVDFVDICPENYCLDPIAVRKHLQKNKNRNIKGIVAVDFAGHSSKIEELKKIADEYGLWIIQDCCHAIGGSYKDSTGKMQTIGNCAYADVGIFSFHPVKHVTTAEGGALTTNNEALAKKIKLLRTHGITKDGIDLSREGWRYAMVALGNNYRIPDILCALGASQLKHLKGNIERRQEIAKRYQLGLQSVGDIVLPKVDASVGHAYHLYVIQTKRREALYNFLKEKKIYTQVHYIPINQQPYYQNFEGSKFPTPNAFAYYERCLSLPMYHGLSNTQQDFVIEQIKSFFKEV
jgi:UDP-4-amino-4,6-dideoxy-N-acetyl-beta-L-altrosamine transaminase